MTDLLRNRIHGAAAAGRTEQTLADRLVALTGVRSDVSGPELGRLLRGLTAAEWDDLVLLAKLGRVSALVAEHLETCGLLPLLPAGVRAGLLEARRSQFVAFVRQGQLVQRLGCALTAAGIEFRLLKGLAVAQQCYPVAATRAVGDVDIWVRPADLPEAMRVLTAQQFAHVTDLDSRPLAFQQAYGKEFLFVGRPPDTASEQIDLHWHATAPWWMRATLRIPERALFTAADPVQIGEQAFQTLAPTENFYYLCLHAALGHRFRTLHSLVDLAFLAASGRVVWRRLFAMSFGSGVQVIIWCTLQTLDSLFGTHYAALLRWSPPPAQRRLLKQLWHPAGSIVAPSSADTRDVGVPCWMLLLLPDTRAVARALLLWLWPSQEWLRLRYAAAPGQSVLRTRVRHLARLRHVVGL